MSKLASVYERKGKLYVSASHKTEAGFWVSDPSISVVDQGDEASVREVIVVALAASKNSITTPPRDADHISPLLEAARVSSWSTFSKLAKHVDIHLKDGVIEITPYKNMGGSDGFDPMTANVITIREGDSKLGSAVLEAIKIAE